MIVANDKGQRCCETQIGRKFGHANASAHTTNLARIKSRQSRLLVDSLKEMGWSHDVAASQGAERPGKWMFEVYPHPAHIVLFDLPKIISYKKGKLCHKRAGLSEFREGIVGKLANADLSLGSKQKFLDFMAVDLETLGGTQLKALEDTADAVLCMRPTPDIAAFIRLS